jgi:hypothetical protein
MSLSAPDPAKADLDAARRMAGLAAGYKPLPGIPDEFIGADGVRARIGCGFSPR